MRILDSGYPLVMMTPQDFVDWWLMMDKQNKSSLFVAKLSGWTGSLLVLPWFNPPGRHMAPLSHRFKRRRVPWVTRQLKQPLTLIENLAPQTWTLQQAQDMIMALPGAWPSSLETYIETHVPKEGRIRQGILVCTEGEPFQETNGKNFCWQKMREPFCQYSACMRM